MNLAFTIEFWILALLSTWMTSTAILVLRAKKHRVDEMRNLHHQVIGSVKSGDLPRAILILEGEEGPLAAILSSVLTEATKFTPKLKVAYKVTVESLKRRGMIMTNPLRIVTMLSVFIGILGFVIPLVMLIAGRPAHWDRALLLLIIAFVISAVSYSILLIADRQQKENLEVASELGREMLSYLLSPESPLRSIRGKSFPLPQ